MIFEAALAALFVGILSGGSPKDLLNFKPRMGLLLVLSVVFSLIPRLPYVGTFISDWGSPASVTLAVVRYGLLVVFAVYNIRFRSICLIGLGGLSNFTATVANGGAMPVSAAALGVNSHDSAAILLKSGQILNYQLADQNTRLLPLCDVIRFRAFYVYFLSIGDLMISAGVFALILVLMKPKLFTKIRELFHTKRENSIHQ